MLATAYRRTAEAGWPSVERRCSTCGAATGTTIDVAIGKTVSQSSIGQPELDRMTPHGMGSDRLAAQLALRRRAQVVGEPGCDPSNRHDRQRYSRLAMERSAASPIANSTPVLLGIAPRTSSSATAEYFVRLGPRMHVSL
jgi:hypothetical protein